MKIILAGIETMLLEAWEVRFSEMENVEIFRGSIFDTDADAIVSPANSFGFMDGGLVVISTQEQVN